jgi:glycosyltransferase involved in cell wall biosynthesis
LTLRVLIVSHEHPELSPGGAEIAAYLAFSRLKEIDGVEPYFLARSGDPARQRSTPFSTHRGRADEILFFSDQVDGFLFSQGSPLVIEEFAALLARIRPHVLHFHHYAYIGLELIATARRVDPKIRVIVTLHEYLAICNYFGHMIKSPHLQLCNEASPHNCAGCFHEISADRFLLRERFIKAHFEKVDLFIAPSEFLRQRYIAWGLPAWQITVLENGTPPVQPPPPRPLADGERRSVFAFFGQITPFKGLDRLLLAFEQLNQLPAEATHGIRLIVHGGNLEMQPPQFVEYMRNLLNRNPARVHFAGGYSNRDLTRLMASVDWVVVPSIWWENAPLVIEEALVCRRPILCSNIGGMAEKVRRGKDGFHFPVGDPFALAGQVVQLAADATIWDRLQSTMRTPPTVAETVSQLLALYRDRSFALAH